MKYVFLVVMALNAANAFGQTIKKNGFLQLIQRDGKVDQIPFKNGITMRLASCTQLVINNTSYDIFDRWGVNGEIFSKIIIPPSCDNITTSIVEATISLNPRQLDFTLYPNPSSGQVRLILQSSAIDLVTIQVFNILGLLVHKFEPVEVNNSPLELSWNFKNVHEASLPSGIYLICAVTSGRIVTHPIIYYH